LSALNAGELGKTVGDEIVLIIGGDEMRFAVCGVYSDVTNGGMTAKAIFNTNAGEVLWSSVPVSFYEGTAVETKISEYKTIFPFAKVSSIDEHMGQVFGGAIAAVRISSYVSIGAAVLLTALVTLLFMKMLVTKDRYPVAVLKSLGFSNQNIGTQYKTRGFAVLVPGLIIGTLLANTVGEFFGTALISSFGVSAFNFDVNPLFAYVFAPALIALCVYASVLAGISDIGRVKISEHIKEA
jgi:putative ABC transport system permease protein